MYLEINGFGGVVVGPTHQYEQIIDIKIINMGRITYDNLVQLTSSE